jgi:adenylate kinase
MDNNVKIIILGPPGVGKTEQSKIIAEKFQLSHFTTANVIRDAVRTNTMLGQQFKMYTKQENEHIPDKLIVKLLTEAISKDKNARKNGWVLESFPRSAEQYKLLQIYGIHADIIILVDGTNVKLEERICNRVTDPVSNIVYNLVTNPPPANEKHIISRLVKNRSDTKVTLSCRLEVYKLNVGALKDALPSGKLEIVDGTQTIETVSIHVDRIINTFFRQKQIRLDKKTKKINKLVNVIGSAFFLNVIQTTETMSANSTMMLQASSGDASKAARTMGMVSTIGALLEFLLNPLLGRLSDCYGRRVFVLLGSIGTTMMDLFVNLNPNSLSHLIARTILSTLFNTLIVTSVRAGLSDQIGGKELGVANAKVGILAGVAIIIGPIFGTFSQKYLGNKNVFLISTIVGFINVLNLLLRFDETLKEEDKKQNMDWAAANPASFLKLITNGSRKMASYALSLGFQCIAEPRFIFPYAMLTWETVYKYSPVKRGNFAAIFGVSYVFGAMIAKSRLSKIGLEAHISESNLSNLVGFLIWSFRQDTIGTVCALLCMTFGIRKRDGLEIMLLKEGGKQKWGKGETYAYISNFKSASAIISPVIMGNIYAYTTKRKGTGYHGSPMFIATFVTLFAEICFRYGK